MRPIVLINFTLTLLLAFTSATSQTIQIGGSSAQNEEKSFLDDGYGTRTEVCHEVRQKALRWIEENTDRSHRFHYVNQVKRGWVARSEGVTQCDCSPKSNGYQTCSVVAKITSLDSGTTHSAKDKAIEQSFLGVGFSQTSACDDTKNRAHQFAASGKRVARTGSCQCEARPGTANSVMWQCRVDALIE